MGNVYPFEDGQSCVDPDTLSVTSTFTIGQDMVNLGYKMVSAEVDESGYFLVVEFENTRLNHIRNVHTGIPLCKEDADVFVILDTENENRKCPKCYAMVEQKDYEKEGDT